MGRLRSYVARGLSGLKQLASWYLAPIGLLFGFLLFGALVATALDSQRLALVLLIGAVGFVVPWKLIRQHSELRTHVVTTGAVLEQLSAQVVLTPTFDDVETTLKGFRRANRKAIRDMRERVLEMQLDQSMQAKLLAEEKNRNIEANRSVRELVVERDDMATSIEQLAHRVAELERALDSAHQDDDHDAPIR